eukprot:7317661-Pyramimonas_sp.AAC.1
MFGDARFAGLVRVPPGYHARAGARVPSRPMSTLLTRLVMASLSCHAPMVLVVTFVCGAVSISIRLSLRSV